MFAALLCQGICNMCANEADHEGKCQKETATQTEMTTNTSGKPLVFHMRLSSFCVSHA